MPSPSSLDSPFNFSSGIVSATNQYVAVEPETGSLIQLADLISTLTPATTVGILADRPICHGTKEPSIRQMDVTPAYSTSEDVPKLQ